MRPWANLAARLYPAAWRARYGREFQALLDDAPPRPADVFGILWEATLMQLAIAKPYARLAAAVGIAGAIAAFGLSFAMPNSYRSSAMLTIAAASPARDREIIDELFSRASLAELMLRPSLDLYRGPRAREPLVAVIDAMRRDLRIRQAGPAGGAARTYAVEFDYPDRYKARAVVREIVAHLSGAYAGLRQAADNPVVERAITLPEVVVRPDRVALAACGLGLGGLAGLLACLIRRRPRRWTLEIAGLGTAGLVLAVAASYAIPSTYLSYTLVRARPNFALDREAVAVPRLRDLVEKFHLYGRHPDAVERLRRNLKITPVSSNTYTVSFAYSGREQTYAVVRELIQTLNRWDKLPPIPNSPEDIPQLNVKVINPAFYPEAAAAPNHALLGLAGLLVGIALGLWRRLASSPALGDPRSVA